MTNEEHAGTAFKWQLHITCIIGVLLTTVNIMLAEKSQKGKVLITPLMLAVMLKQYRRLEQLAQFGASEQLDRE